MFCRKTLVVWVGIIALSGLFLAGQDTWGPTCVDNDGDGYGDPASTGCAHPMLDCNDADAGVNPGVIEGPSGNAKCGDAKDNDCDGKVDLADLGCVPCVDHDADGYGQEASGNCTYPFADCNDSNSNVNPGEQEGPSGDPTCTDLLDNDCDEHTDAADPRCSLQDMVQIPAGCFAMGDSYGGGAADELPVHNVCISAFAIDSTEVTNADYLECVADNGCTAPSSFSSRGRPDYYGDAAFSDYPVIWVTWDQARGYCSWAGKRLPTEAEWEYAARGGLAMQRYPNGNEIACEDANYARSSPLDPCWNYNGLDNDTHPVASYPANGYGVYDMAGNAFEWVNDRYLANYYESSPVNDPQGPTTGSARVYRGGAFTNVAAAVRVSDRNNRAPAGANYNIGFRCAQ